MPATDAGHRNEKILVFFAVFFWDGHPSQCDTCSNLRHMQRNARQETNRASFRNRFWPGSLTRPMRSADPWYWPKKVAYFSVSALLAYQLSSCKLFNGIGLDIRIANRPPTLPSGICLVLHASPSALRAKFQPCDRFYVMQVSYRRLQWCQLFRMRFG